MTIKKIIEKGKEYLKPRPLKKINTILLTGALLCTSVPNSTPVLASSNTSIIINNSNTNKTSNSSNNISKSTEFNLKNATIYFAMTDRFYNGNLENDESYGRKKVDAKGLNTGTFNGGDFKGITEKIKSGYFTDLGVTAIWISPPYEQIHGFITGGKNGEFAHYAYHGYYALDYTMVDRNFGTIEEFRELVDEAHSKDIRIIMDVVVNHTGYSTLQDMEEFSFGKVNEINGTWEPKNDENYNSFHQYVDYEDEEAWSTWWGKEWVRTGLPGYEEGDNSDLRKPLFGLPDIKTESKNPVDLPPILKTKWYIEDNSYNPWRLPKYEALRKKKDLPPAGYISSWLVAWVEEFGIDGFRIDTAKHVDLEVWKNLKIDADKALKTWRLNNPKKYGANFKDDFFMVGEVWGYNPVRNEYYDNGFDALINFAFQGESNNGPAHNKKTMDITFNNYSKLVNEDQLNFLSYISSHDTSLYPRKKLKDGITYLALLPGAIEIFYGDELGRPFVEGHSDLMQSLRGYMNWETLDEEILNHSKKMFSFRKKHLSIGAGKYELLNKEPFVFLRSLDEDIVVVAMDVKGNSSIDVSHLLKEGVVHDFYENVDYNVKDGKITIDSDKEILLLELINNVR